MAKVTVSLPQGTRDFGPEVVRKRNYITDTIKQVFELYGFQPLETPAMENSSTLLGKYGEEGDKLIFRILESGNPYRNKPDFFRIITQALKNTAEEYRNIAKGFDNINETREENERFQNPFGNPIWDLNPEVIADFMVEYINKNEKEFNLFLPTLKNQISEKALRYDLTIPFARYVAMNHTQLPIPFKRYQIQPVWRADRPQKGRYREFWQCDCDVVGSTALINEIELANIYHEVFTRLKVTGYELRVNSRKILAGLAELCGGSDQLTNITVAIDKLDKIGLEKVKEELATRGLSPNQIMIIETYLAIEGSNEEKLEKIKTLFKDSETGQKGIAEIEYLFDSRLLTPDSRLIIDFTLARGLNYYTGIIFEAKAPETVKIGSIGGGGRYDDLTGLFGVPGIPGVGVSFGLDRIYDVLEEMKVFPETVQIGTQVLFFNTGTEESKSAFVTMQQLRAAGVRCELYHETAKFDKQFKYAEKKGIPYIIIIGSREIADNTFVCKDLRKGTQETIPLSTISNISFI